MKSHDDHDDDEEDFDQDPLTKDFEVVDSLTAEELKSKFVDMGRPWDRLDP